MIDLHIHTTASDGQYEPGELISKAISEGIQVISVTDHDSIGGIEAGQKRAQELNIEFIPGIEISVAGAKEMHILGYYIDINSKPILSMCERFIELRKERANKIIDYLTVKGVPITLEEVSEYAKNELMARPHFARVLLKKGYIDSYREAFDKYLATPEFDKIERPKPTPEEGIKMIHDAGGIAVLAHPSSLNLTDTVLEKNIKNLISLGLDGIETYYSQHTALQISKYHSIAQKYGLLETIGSDFHGEKVKPNIYLGMGSENLSAEEIKKILIEISSHQ